MLVLYIITSMPVAQDGVFLRSHLLTALMNMVVIVHGDLAARLDVEPMVLGHIEVVLLNLSPNHQFFFFVHLAWRYLMAQVLGKEVVGRSVVNIHQVAKDVLWQWVTITSHIGLVP